MIHGILSWVLTVLIPIFVTLGINIFDNRNKKRQALYQRKYEFWLDFAKSYFSICPFLLFMTKKDNLNMGIITDYNSEKIKEIYKGWLAKWNKFNEMVIGNEDIYLKKEGIDILIMQAFFASFEENLPSIEIVSNNDTGIKKAHEFYTIQPESVKNIIQGARKIFELNLKPNSELHERYVQALNVLIERDRLNNNHGNSSDLSYEEMIKKIANISDAIFIDTVKENIIDTKEKLKKIVCSNS